MSSESDPGNLVAGGVTRSIANGGVATGVAYGFGLSPQLSGAVGATVIAVSGAGEAVAVLNRRMRGSPGPKEVALRSIILDYLSEMEKRLPGSGQELQYSAILRMRSASGNTRTRLVLMTRSLLLPSFP